MSRIPLLSSLASALALAVSAPAYSKTYYVDSLNGNDIWSGELSSPSGGSGPWQSLYKVSNTALLPGDSVLLKCGSIWYETLSIKGSGTSTAPIVVGSYPSACSNKPIISGAFPIPAHNWVQETGNIYKTSSAIDLITAGSFENGLGNWTSFSPNNDAVMNVSSSCAQAGSACLSFVAGAGKSLLISNNFVLLGKQSYTAAFMLKAPAGVPIRVVLRRGVTPWSPAGLDKTITGTGAWQTYSLPFSGTASLASARLDFEVPATQAIALDNVRITTNLTAVKGLFDNGKSVNEAHHPNRGYNTAKPDSLFFPISQSTDKVSWEGKTGSTYLVAGSELSAAALSSLKPGAGIRIRTNAWNISDRKIASISGSRFNLDIPTTYPVVKDWGYYLYGQRWMLDEPGEWSYDTTAKSISVWMKDGASPGNRLSVNQRAVGIDVNNRSHVRVEGISVLHTETGVRMNQTSNVVLKNMDIFDTIGLGIEARLSTDSGVENSQVIRAGGDAIYADTTSLRFHAYDNLIMDSGAQTTNGALTSLPVPSEAAIEAGRTATIRRNRIYGASYIGIRPMDKGLVSGNHVENSCLVLDDCGAIYTDGQNNNGIIENNTVRSVKGGLAGKPSYSPSQSQGIYLDALSSGITVRGNTVTGADSGLQLYSAANNHIEGNTLYGNRRHEIWLQEGTNKINAAGDTYGNVIVGNRFFPTLGTAAIGQATELAKTNTYAFAGYDSNLYFTLLSPTIAAESWPSGGTSFTLPSWQTAITSGGQPRGLEPAGQEINSATIGYAAFQVVGANIMPNGSFTAGKTGWTYWNSTAPYGQIVLEACTPAPLCLRYTAGASESLLSSPNFSTVKDQWYKVSFDLKTSSAGQLIPVVARRGGGGTNGYEFLMPAPVSFSGSTTWKRYSFNFKAIKTVNAQDPVTLDKGARVDFTRVMPGQSLSVTNLQIVPLSSTETTLRSHVLINPTSSNLSVNCPDAAGAQSCYEYVRFTDGVPVSWPYSLPPNGSEVIYTRNSNLIDADGDGVPNFQDSCSGTGASLAVNGAGCTLGQ